MPSFTTTYAKNDGERVIIKREGKTVTLTLTANGPTVTIEMSLDDWLTLTQRY